MFNPLSTIYWPTPSPNLVLPQKPTYVRIRLLLTLIMNRADVRNAVWELERKQLSKREKALAIMRVVDAARQTGTLYSINIIDGIVGLLVKNDYRSVKPVLDAVPIHVFANHNL